MEISIIIRFLAQDMGHIAMDMVNGENLYLGQKKNLYESKPKNNTTKVPTHLPKSILVALNMFERKS